MVRTALLKTACAVLALSCLMAAPATAVVVTFESLTESGPVPDGHGGINWHDLWQHYGTPQFPYTPHSGEQRIYNDPRISDVAFDFVVPDQVFEGGWFAGIAAFAEVGFDLYNDNVLVHATPRSFISDVPLFIAAGYSGPVDQVRVYSSQGDFYVLDDVQYSTAAVPEPSTWLLLATGLLGLLGYGYRRRQRAA